MSFVVIGTDHRFQNSERGFEAILRAWLEERFIYPLTSIAEEYHERIGMDSIAKRLAAEKGLRWYNLDMTTEEKVSAGILEDQSKRPMMFRQEVAHRVPSDDVREGAWVRKLVESASGTTLVICGYLHFEALVKQLRAKDYVVDKRVYLETVPKIEAAKSPWISTDK